jgi:hypothetical protein
MNGNRKPTDEFVKNNIKNTIVKNTRESEISAKLECVHHICPVIHVSISSFRELQLEETRRKTNGADDKSIITLSS